MKMTEKSNEKVKTTLFISKEDRKIIESTGKTLEKFFEELMKFYKTHTLDRWKPGTFFQGYLRVCIIRADTLTDLISNLKTENLRQFGRKEGKKELVYLKTSGLIKLDKPEIQSSEEELAELFNQHVGYGKIELLSDSILVENPILTGNLQDYLWGYLEGLLSTELELIESYADRQIYGKKTSNIP